MHRTHHFLGVFLLIMQTMMANPALAGLVYEAHSVVDTITGLRWQSTLATLDQPGLNIPLDRAWGEGWRFATQDEVATLFTGNFPQLAPILNTWTPTPIDPEIGGLLGALGGQASTATLASPEGDIELTSYMLNGWIVGPKTPTMISEPFTWEYRLMYIGYAGGCTDLPCVQPVHFFHSGAPAYGVAELSPADTASSGFFLVSSVPEPASALLLVSGLLCFALLRRQKLRAIGRFAPHAAHHVGDPRRV